MYYYIFICCKQQICTRQIGSVPISVAWRGAGGQSGMGYKILSVCISCGFMHEAGTYIISLYYSCHPSWRCSFLCSVTHLTPMPPPRSLKYAVPMFLSALTDVVAYPPQFLPSLFLPPSLLGVGLPPHGLPLLGPVGGTSVAAPARHPHLVSASQHWTMFLLTSRLTVLKS